MKKSKAIDLTVIGMGYFKTIEQLLFEIICLHKNEGRLIKKDYSRRDLPTMIELNDTNISDAAIDTTLGAMAVFYRDNLDIFRNDLSYQTRKFLVETIFKYKDLRNGYFHKDNIHEKAIIEEIHDATYELLFLLLGAKTLSNENRATLGYPEEIRSDFYKLCEYVNYHHGELFFLENEEGKEIIVSGYYDEGARIINEKQIEYTGVYFKSLSDIPHIQKFSKDDIPYKVSLGKLVYGYSDKLSVVPTKIKPIYENNHYVGPLIAEEEKLDY